jgi:hypothetical protein
LCSDFAILINLCKKTSTERQLKGEEEREKFLAEEREKREICKVE